MIALPCPTAPAAALAGQMDAKDATGRIDAYYTAGGLPVAVVEPGGLIWLVTVFHPDGDRRVWMIGDPSRALHLAKALARSAEAQRCNAIDELLTDEGGEP